MIAAEIIEKATPEKRGGDSIEKDRLEKVEKKKDRRRTKRRWSFSLRGEKGGMERDIFGEGGCV